MKFQNPNYVTSMLIEFEAIHIEQFKPFKKALLAYMENNNIELMTLETGFKVDKETIDLFPEHIW